MSVLDGEVAIVTGGSRGIGRAVAVELAQAGARVVVGYLRQAEAAAETVAQIEALGGTGFALQADVTDEDAMSHLARTTLAHLGRIDVLVTSAGIVRDQLAAAMRLDVWDGVIATNLRGSFLAIRAVLPAMIAQKKGAVVALSSVAAVHGSRGHANYAAAKGGINALVRALAVELARKKIRVNAVAPGIIETEMSRPIRQRAGEEIRRRIPLGRFGDPREVARAVRFLASSEASYVTGEILHVTGGLGL